MRRLFGELIRDPAERNNALDLKSCRPYGAYAYGASRSRRGPASGNSARNGKAAAAVEQGAAGAGRGSRYIELHLPHDLRRGAASMPVAMTVMRGSRPRHSLPVGAPDDDVGNGLVERVIDVHGRVVEFEEQISSE